MSAPAGPPVHVPESHRDRGQASALREAHKDKESYLRSNGLPLDLVYKRPHGVIVGARGPLPLSALAQEQPQQLQSIYTGVYSEG